MKPKLIDRQKRDKQARRINPYQVPTSRPLQLIRVLLYGGFMKCTDLTEGSTIKDGSGNYFTVIKINSWDNVECVYVKTGFRFIGQKSNIVRGSTRDRYAPNAFGAFIGSGIYNEDSKCEGRLVYSVWKNMIARCLNPKNKAYKRYGGSGVTICQDWMNYQNFAKWYFENYPKDGKKYQIDKDYYGNKTYSPSCVKFLTAKQNIIISNAKKYKIEYVDGTSENIVSLADYARRTNRSQSVLSRMANGMIKNKKANIDILKIIEI